jgi:peptidoglycan/LPS O-acetylase OafA/YrhL
MSGYDLTFGGTGGRRAHMTQLDALRCFAVLAVLVAHLWQPEPLPWIFARIDWGELGVRLFFVLSGFLITGILLGAGRGATGRVGQRHVMQQFYVRRFLRIFPIYYLVLVVCLIFAVAPVREVWPWLFTYTTNIYIWEHTEFMPNVGHFWTLAVEEQFYLVWPLLVLFAPRRRLLPILLAVVASALVYRLYASFAYPADIASGAGASTTLIFGVIDSLGLGALLALCMSPDAGPLEIWLRRGLWIALPAGIVLYVGTLMLVHVHPGSHLGAMIGQLGLALAFCWLIGRASRGFGGATGRVLELPPLLYLGRISYGIYIFHMLVPVLLAAIAEDVGLDYKDQGFLYFVVAASATVAISALSWHAFEAPLNRLKRHFPYRDASERAARASRTPAVQEGSS